MKNINFILITQWKITLKIIDVIRFYFFAGFTCNSVLGTGNLDLRHDELTVTRCLNKAAHLEQDDGRERLDFEQVWLDILQREVAENTPCPGRNIVDGQVVGRVAGANGAIGGYVILARTVVKGKEGRVLVNS